MRSCLPALLGTSPAPMTRVAAQYRSISALRRTAARREGAKHVATSAARGLLTQFRPDINGLRELTNVNDSFDIDDMSARDASEVSYVSRRRLEIAGFDVNAVDEVRLAFSTPDISNLASRHFPCGLCRCVMAGCFGHALQQALTLIGCRVPAEYTSAPDLVAVSRCWYRS